MGETPENRLERIVSDLMRGRRLNLRARDAEEKEAIVMAARLAAARQGAQRMTPAFRQQLARRLEATPREGWVTRRTAMVAGLGIAAGTVGGLLAGHGLAGPQPVAAKEIVPDGGRWIDVGAVSDFPAGTPRQVKAGAVGAFVTRRDEQSVIAVSSICSDLPCELWWDPAQSLLSCPCHNKTFTAEGGAVDAYTLPPLDTVRVRITAEGRVELFAV